MNKEKDILVCKLQDSLVKMGRKALWSYDLSNLPEKISDKIIIEKILLFGDINNWQDLKKAYSIEYIKDVWLQNMALGGFHPEKQEQIAQYFFKINNLPVFLAEYRDNYINDLVERAF